MRQLRIRVGPAASLITLAVAGMALGQGQVVGWGGNTYGETRAPVESLLRYTRVACGGAHTYALRSDGTVAGWGSNAAGQTTTPSGLDGIDQVACGANHSYMVRNTGAVLGWGDNTYGQTTTPTGLGAVRQISCGFAFTAAAKMDGTVAAWGDGSSGQIAVPAGLVSARQVACGDRHAVALQADGTAVGWGFNGSGQSVVPSGLGGVAQVACGSNHAYAVKSDGTVVGWGSNSVGQVSTPAGLSGVVQVACGFAHTCALKSDGTVVGWGSNFSGQTATPAGLGGIAQIACGRNHTYALKADGTMVGWGSSGSGQTTGPARLAGVTQVSCGVAHSYALKSDGTVTGWGANGYGMTSTPAGLAGVSQVACGLYHTYALKSDGTLVGWGAGAGAGWPHFGQTSTPAGLSGVVQVACGFAHTCALKSDGTVVGWGGDTYGQATAPAGLASVSRIACGVNHTLARKSDGTVVGWGDNAYVQATAPSGLAGVASVSGGDRHSYALAASGTVVGWGDNLQGQTSTPAGLGGVVQVACGLNHTCALKSDGSVVGWGRNDSGQSVAPAALSGVTAIACGDEHSVGVIGPGLSACSNAGGAGTASIEVSGGSWQQVSAWRWTNGGGPQVPGALTTVDLGNYGSVGSDCSANASTLTTRSGTSLLVPASASAPGNDFSIRVGDAANLAGRLWLLGVSGGGSTLPANLNVPVLSAGTVNGNFDLIQTDVPPPAGKFLTLVPETVNGRTVLSLRLFDLPGGGSLAGSSSANYTGTAVAAATIDLNQDGYDDLALAVDFGASQPGLIQVLMNDGAGNLGGTSVLETIVAQPTCIAAGDVDGDGRPDLVAGFASDSTARVYRRNPSNALDLLPGTVLSGFTGTPRSVAVVPASSGTLATMKKARVKPRAMTAGSNVAVGTSTAKLYFYSSVGVETQPALSLGGTVEVMASGRNVDGVGSGGIATGGIRSNTVDGLVATETGYVSVISDRGSGYAVRQTMNITAKPRGIDVADIDDDGLDDIVTANAEPQQPDTGSGLPVLSIFRNRPTGFAGGVPCQPAGASSGLDVALIDVDGDGDRDIVSVYKRVGADSEAALLRVDTLGAGTPISIGQTTVLDASDPILSKRGNLDGVGGEDVFLVVQPASGSAASFMPPNPFVKPYLSQQDARRGDLDGNGSVDAGDIAVLLLRFGTADAAADLDGSGTVDAGDIGVLLLLFG